MDATVITAIDKGRFLVERIWSGVVIDRYVTHDLSAPRRKAPWAAYVNTLASDPSADVHIGVPTVPVPLVGVQPCLCGGV